MNLEEKITELVDSVKKTSKYKNYKKAKKDFENDPEAVKILKNFQKAKSELAILKQGNFEGIKEQEKKVKELADKVLAKDEIQNYMKSRKQYKELVEEIAVSISEGIDFPIKLPEKKSCCG